MPTEWKQKIKAVLLEFEGIYKNSTITVNGQKAGGRPYGYTGFAVDIVPYPNYGGENTIRITTRSVHPARIRVQVETGCGDGTGAGRDWCVELYGRYVL